MNAHLEFLKSRFRDWCSGNLVLRQIDNVFTSAGFSKGETDPSLTQTRRDLVDQYYQGADWEKAETLQRFAAVLEFTLRLSDLPDESKDKLRTLCQICFEVDSDGYTVHVTNRAFGHDVKNLIFAANGPKPEIVLSDSVSNDIRIVKYEEYCLVYEQPVEKHGLLLRELVDWWRQKQGGAQDRERELRDSLLLRLRSSLESPAERFLFETYYRCFYPRLKGELPALVPQVYLHYDPYTVRQLQGKKRLERQRMDFLLLFPKRTRIVIEVDGRQHYADDQGIARPEIYAKMVAEDRKLQLAGYEVYRFGGYELQGADRKHIVEEFFFRLFEKHDITLASV